MKHSLRLRLQAAAIISLSSLFLANCGAEDDSATPPCATAGATGVGPIGPDYVSCRDIEDCQTSDFFPACGDYANVSCFRPDPNDPSLNTCLFRIIDDANCPCMERDMRGCDRQPGRGIQHCVRPDAAQVRTEWGPCGAS